MPCRDIRPRVSALTSLPVMGAWGLVQLMRIEDSRTSSTECWAGLSGAEGRRESLSQIRKAWQGGGQDYLLTGGRGGCQYQVWLALSGKLIDSDVISASGQEIANGDRRGCVWKLWRSTPNVSTCSKMWMVDFYQCHSWGVRMPYSAFLSQSRLHWAHTPPWSQRWWSRPTSMTQRSCLTWFPSPIPTCPPLEAAGSSLPLISPLEGERNISDWNLFLFWVKGGALVHLREPSVVVNSKRVISRRP